MQTSLSSSDQLEFIPAYAALKSKEQVTPVHMYRHG
jgi:hypothetical protein